MISLTAIVEKLITQGSLSANLSSKIITTKHLKTVSLQVNMTTPVPDGVFHVLKSNDGINFIDVFDLQKPTSDADANGCMMWEISEIAAHYMRSDYDSTDGTGTVDLYFIGKGI
jgi:hypothetical protein